MMVAIYFAVMPFAIAYLLIGFRLHYGRVPSDAQMQAQMLREVWAEWARRKERASPAHRCRRAWAIRHLLRPFVDAIEMNAEIDRICRIWSAGSQYTYRRM